MLDIIIIIAARPLLIDAGEQIMYLKFNQDNKIVLKKKKKEIKNGKKERLSQGFICCLCPGPLLLLPLFVSR